MQKYIAVVNPRMDKDDISALIAKGIAGALFEIIHQNYPLAAKLIGLVQDLSTTAGRPISIIQDVSSMEDPLDLEFGLKGGVDWILTDKEQHLKTARGLNKLAGLIYKGRNLPKTIRVDSIMADDFVDPDAQVMGMKNGSIKHIIMTHPNQKSLDSLMDIAKEAHTQGIAVSDLDLAKALSWRRHRKIVFVPKNPKLASKGALYWGVHPVFLKNDLAGSLSDNRIFKKGERVVDATDIKHVAINLVK